MSRGRQVSGSSLGRSSDRSVSGSVVWSSGSLIGQAVGGSISLSVDWSLGPPVAHTNDRSVDRSFGSCTDGSGERLLSGCMFRSVGGSICQSLE